MRKNSRYKGYEWVQSGKEFNGDDKFEIRNDSMEEEAWIHPD